jgi:hypothetical protein
MNRINILDELDPDTVGNSVRANMVKGSRRSEKMGLFVVVFQSSMSLQEGFQGLRLFRLKEDMICEGGGVFSENRVCIWMDSKNKEE